MKKLLIICLMFLVCASALAVPRRDAIDSRADIERYTLDNAGTGTGSVFYVDSGVVTEGNGTSWTEARDTLDEGINLCTASRGDRVYVAQGHAETFLGTNAASVTAAGFDIAGITVIGEGNGTLMPTFTFSSTGIDTIVDISAANVSLNGLRFIGTKDGLGGDTTGNSGPIKVGAAGVTIADCEFIDTTTLNTTKWIYADATSDDLTIANCVNKGTDTTGNVSFIQFSGTTDGAIANIRLINNRSNGSFSAGNVQLINGSLTDSDVRNNRFENSHAVDVNMELLTSTNSGWVSDNYMRIATTGQTTWINPTVNGMSMFENYGTAVGSASGHLTPSNTVN